MKLKTLIIDDHPQSITLLKELLDDYCDCFVATSGLKGLELFEDAQNSTEPFEVVLLDIIMPGLDGIETLNRLRQLELVHHAPTLFEKQHSFTRVIMQTSSEDPMDFLASFKSKCNGFINKPYSKDEIIDKVLGKRKI